MKWGDVRPIVDALTSYYIKNHSKEEYKQLVIEKIGQETYDDLMKQYPPNNGDGGDAPTCPPCTMFCHIIGLTRDCYPCWS